MVAHDLVVKLGINCKHVLPTDSVSLSTLLQLRQLRGDQAKLLYENTLLWLLQSHRLLESVSEPDLWVHALDYVIHREIAKKLAEEQAMDEQEGQVLNLPFKMRMQDILADNKAIDELTAKDIEQRKKDQEAEIEANFPSYFDEF